MNKKSDNSAAIADAELLRALMDGAADNFYFKDRESRFIRINRAMARSLGLKSPDEAVGKSDADYFPAEHAAQALAEEREILRTGKPLRNKEEKITWPDGRISWVSASKALFHDKNGETLGTFGISSDITPLKQKEANQKLIEDNLQRSEKLESLGMLASGIAHDFNNLLLGVLGNASLILHSEPEGSKIYGTVEQIETAATRAADLTSQLLAYAGRGCVTVAATDLSVLAKEMGKLLEVIVSKNVTLTMDLASDLPSIEADPTQMRQVIMNLIKNASDALGDRTGTITVTTGILEGGASHHPGAVHVGELPLSGTCVFLEVADTGPGMPAEIQKRVFDPFFTTKSTGRGLGLATVQGVVRGHKGAIILKSTPGHGTSFKVMFKASGKPTASEKAASHAGKQKAFRGSGTIMVVDDEPIVRQVASQMAEALGFKAIAVSSGAEAVKVFEARKDDIVAVLLDDVMPHMKGDAVFAELKRIRQCVKVILCSGYTKQDAMSKFPGKGLAGFVHKPFTIVTLSQELEAVLGS